MPAFLELLYEGRGIVVDSDEVILGRVNACTIRVIHPLVSRQHCRIDVRPEGVFAEDLGSSNGTFLNGSQISGIAKVHAGDRISLGRGGAELTLITAEFNGADVGRAEDDDEAGKQTFLAGDPRAAGLRARVSVASEALPQLEPVGDSIADQDIDAVSEDVAPAVGNLSDDLSDDGYEEEPPTRLAGDNLPGLGPLPYDHSEDDLDDLDNLDDDDDFPSLDEPEYVSPHYDRMAAAAAGEGDDLDEPETRLGSDAELEAGAAAASLRDRVRKQKEIESSGGGVEATSKEPPRREPPPARRPASGGGSTRPVAPPEPKTVKIDRPAAAPAAQSAAASASTSTGTARAAGPAATGRFAGLLVGLIVGVALVAALALFTPLAAGVYKLPFAPILGASPENGDDEAEDGSQPEKPDAPKETDGEDDK